MKEKLQELFKTICVLILAILIISLVLFALVLIAIKTLNIPMYFTYSNAVGIILCISIIRFIINFLIEGFDIKSLLKATKRDIMPSKKYKFQIIYKNKAETIGTLTANNLQEIKEMLLENNANFVNNGKNLVYYNSDEIQFCEVEELEEDENENNDKSTYER